MDTNSEVQVSALYPLHKSPPSPGEDRLFYTKQEVRQALEFFWTKKVTFILPGITPRFSTCPAYGLSTLSKLFRLWTNFIREKENNGLSFKFFSRKKDYPSTVCKPMVYGFAIVLEDTRQ